MYMRCHARMSAWLRRHRLPVMLQISLHCFSLGMFERLTNGVSLGPQINASHVKKSDSEIGPATSSQEGISKTKTFAQEGTCAYRR
jgi:hypothetical protein